MSEITQFRGILPSASRAFSPPPSKASPGGLIIHALNPLRAELDAALTRGDQECALRSAYVALSRVADALATLRGDRMLCAPSQVCIHALLVKLTPLPLESLADGTLSEVGTQVAVLYRNWIVERPEAQAWAERLTERFQALWPGAWVMMSDEMQGSF